MKQIICVLILIVFVVADMFYLRAVNAIRQVDGAIIDTPNIVPMVTTDRHLINKRTLDGLIKRIATSTMNFRPARVRAHVDSNTIRSFFTSDQTYRRFADSFINWGLAQYDNGDIVFKESVVLSHRSTRTFDAGDGQLLWFINIRMSVRDRAFGEEVTNVVMLKLSLMHKSAAEGVGIYDYELQSI